MGMEKNKIATFTAIILIFFFALFIFTRVAGSIPLTVHNINTNLSDSFESQGTGKASAAPDTAVVNLGITAEASTVQLAQEQANQSATKIINALKAQEINEKDIKTTNYSLNPNYSFSGETQRINGYTVNQTFEVETPIEKANQVIDAATSAGANNIGNITFKLNDKKQEELRNQAREEAVNNAKNSANGLAKAAGIRLGKIINISENFGGNQPQPVTLDARVGQGGEIQNKTEITPGESNVEVTVVLTYQTN